jgi:hypothetical protein
MVIKLLTEVNECVSGLVSENGMDREMKHFFDSVFSDKWIMIVENGSKEKYEQELALAIDPLVDKVMGITGEQFVESMSYEMSSWIKDTSLLWIKNKGAGQTTTEAEINNLRQEDRHERDLKNLAQYYEEKLQKQRDDSLSEMELLRKDH